MRVDNVMVEIRSEARTFLIPNNEYSTNQPTRKFSNRCKHEITACVDMEGTSVFGIREFTTASVSGHDAPTCDRCQGR
jgi:hypothetical protein